MPLTMDLEQAKGATTAFYTLHGCDGDISMAISRVLELKEQNKNLAWRDMLGEYPSVVSRLEEQGISNPFELKDLTWDDSMILFTCSTHLDEDGKPLPIGERLTRERFGRFPWSNGSIIDYLIEFLRPNSNLANSNDSFERILKLLKKLYSFNTENDFEVARYVNGDGGMNILGFLSFEEVMELRKLMTGRNWSVASDEPLDGGIRDAIKHLIAMLKSAERRDSGIMHRAHT